MCAKRLNDWNTMPTSARSCGELAALRGQQLAVEPMVPESMGSSRLIVRHSVDLPDPDGPDDHDDLPRSTSRLMSLSTCSSPKCLSTAASRPSGLESGGYVGDCRSIVNLTQETSQSRGKYVKPSGNWGSPTSPYRTMVPRRCTSPAARAFGDPARTYQVRTYGCQMNVHDSERLAGLLEAAGY